MRSTTTFHKYLIVPVHEDEDYVNVDYYDVHAPGPDGSDSEPLESFSTIDEAKAWIRAHKREAALMNAIDRAFGVQQ